MTSQFTDNSSLEIDFQSEQASIGAFAIDDIFVYPNQCDHSNGYTYTMDYLDDLEVENIRPLKSSIGRIYDTSLAAQYPYAPKGDFTTGKGSYFLVMNMKGDYNVTYDVELKVKNIKATRVDGGEWRPSCVRFAFMLTGDTTSLGVYVQSVDSDYLNQRLFSTQM